MKRKYTIGERLILGAIISFWIAIGFLVTIEWQIQRREDDLRSLHRSVDAIDVAIKNVAETANDVQRIARQFEEASQNNNGRSQIFIDILCSTDDPVRLAKCDELGFLPGE